MVTLLFMHLGLHLIKSASTLDLYRAVYLLMNLCWFTNISGYYIAKNRNISSEVITFMFLVVREDMKNSCNFTTDPDEHELGYFWMKNREFSTLALYNLVESNER